MNHTAYSKDILARSSTKIKRKKAMYIYQREMHAGSGILIHGSILARIVILKIEIKIKEEF